MQSLARQINPTFENDTYVVLPSPSEVAFANCEKVVERDVEIYRKKSQSIRMQPSASRTDIVADAGAHFSPKEQQSIDLFICSPILGTSPRWLWYFEEPHGTISAAHIAMESSSRSNLWLRLIGTI
jgi:hypothetical protein